MFAQAMTADEEFIVGLFLIAFGTGIYLLGAYVLYRVGRKLGVGSYSEYCIPVYQFVLLCRGAGIPGWVGLTPYAGMVFLAIAPEAALIGLLGTYAGSVYLWGSVAQRLGKDFWPWGLGCAFLGIPVLILAFGDIAPVHGGAAGAYSGPAGGHSEPVIAHPEPVSIIYEAHFDDDRSITYDAVPELIGPGPDRRFIRFLTGEYAGQEIEVPFDGIVIGRDPTRAHLVLGAPEISGQHVRLAVDGTRGSQLIVTDLGSTNGTYIQQHTGGAPGWIEIHGSYSASRGGPCRIRLANGAAEFEIV